MKKNLNASVEIPISDAAEIRISLQAQADSIATNRTKDKLSDLD